MTLPIIGPTFYDFVQALSPTDLATLEGNWATIQTDSSYSGPRAELHREIALIVAARALGLPP